MSGQGDGSTAGRRPWSGKPPKLSAEQYARALEVAKLRASIPTKAQLRAMREAIPTNAQLGREMGVSGQTIKNAISIGIKRYEYHKQTQRESST